MSYLDTVRLAYAAIRWAFTLINMPVKIFLPKYPGLRLIDPEWCYIAGYFINWILPSLSQHHPGDRLGQICSAVGLRKNIIRICSNDQIEIKFIESFFPGISYSI